MSESGWPDDAAVQAAGAAFYREDVWERIGHSSGPHWALVHNALVAALASAPPPPAVQGEVEQLRAAIRWALGEEPDADGKWFGETYDEERAKYGWRSHLREIAGMRVLKYDKATRSIVDASAAPPAVMPGREEIARALYAHEFNSSRVQYPTFDDPRTTAGCRRRFLARADAILALSPPSDGWREIASAPKDGTAILIAPSLWLGRSCDVAVWDDDRHSSKPRPYWRRDGENSKSVSRTYPPSNWQPLPPKLPPVAAQDAELIADQ